MTVTAALLGVVILIGALHDTVRLAGVRGSGHPLVARLCGRRASLRAAERQCTGLLLRGRITPADYRARMCRVAHGGNRSAGATTGLPGPHRGGRRR